MMTKIFKTTLMPVLFLLVLLVGTGACTEDNSTGKAGKPLVIDVRTEAEWRKGHLDGALLIPYERIGQEIAKAATDKQETIYLYCRTGRRSAIAKETLKKAGYRSLIDLKSMENASEVLNRGIVQ